MRSGRWGMGGIISEGGRCAGGGGGDKVRRGGGCSNVLGGGRLGADGGLLIFCLIFNFLKWLFPLHATCSCSYKIQYGLMKKKTGIHLIKSLSLLIRERILRKLVKIGVSTFLRFYY